MPSERPSDSSAPLREILIRPKVLYTRGLQARSMVFILDEGSHYEAPIDRVVKLLQSHMTDGAAIHPNLKNFKLERVSENIAIGSGEREVQGKIVSSKARFTMFPPLGVAIEQLEGPMAGSKYFYYYIPKGGRTGVTAVGEFKSPIMSDEQLKQAVNAFLEQVFKEDTAYLETMQ